MWRNLASLWRAGQHATKERKERKGATRIARIHANEPAACAEGAAEISPGQVPNAELMGLALMVDGSGFQLP
jgi:hypothetical protein